MKRIPWPALAGLLLCGAVVDAPSARAGESSSYYKPPPPPTWDLFCTAAQPKRELEDESVIPAIYYSGAFTVTTRNLNPVNEAFVRFLQERYNYQLALSLSQPVTCYSRGTLDEAQAERQNYLSRSLQYAAQTKVVETGWTFGEMTAGSPAPKTQ